MKKSKVSHKSVKTISHMNGFSLYLTLMLLKTRAG